MTLEELNAARDQMTREILSDGLILAKAKELLEAMPQLQAVGNSADHVATTLRHFVNQVNAFMAPVVEPVETEI
jgi:hypothetical protein